MADNDRFAMLVDVSAYNSDTHPNLPPVRGYLPYLRAVLENTEIGMYNDCALVAEPTRAEMLHAVETFLNARQPSGTALLYFSGHGEFCEDDTADQKCVAIPNASRSWAMSWRSRSRGS